MKNIILSIVVFAISGIYLTAFAQTDIDSFEKKIDSTLDTAILTHYFHSITVIVSRECWKKNETDGLECLREYRNGIERSKKAFEEYLALMRSHPYYKPEHEGLNKLPAVIKGVRERSWGLQETGGFIVSQGELIASINNFLEDPSHETKEALEKQQGRTAKVREDLQNNLL